MRASQLCRAARRPAAALASLALAACASGPDPARPAPPDLGAAYREQSGAASAAASWEALGDRDLLAAIDRCLQQHPDALRALERVEEARAWLGGAEAESRPSVAAEASASRARSSENLALPLRGNPNAGRYRAALAASYEIDAWGRLRSLRAAASADCRAAAADAAAVRLSLSAEVARAWFLRRSLEAERAVLAEALALRRQQLSLAETRWDSGLGQPYEVARLRADLHAAAADAEALERQCALLGHAWAALMGGPDPAPTAGQMGAEPPVLPAGLPAELLTRRPDIAAADAALDAAHHRVGVARASFYPALKIGVGLGSESADYASLLDAQSRIWSLGASGVGAVLDSSRNQAQLEVARARVRQAEAAWRSRIVAALREVEDALSDIRQLDRQARELEAVRSALAEAEEIATARQDKGLGSFLEVLDARRSRLATERSLAQLQGQRWAARVALCRALGGGWDGAGTPERR